MREENTAAEELELIPLTTIAAVIQDVIRKWYVILAAALIAAMAAFVWADITYTPEYATKTTFVVTAGGTNTTTYQNLSAANSLATVFSEVLNSSVLRDKVMEQVGAEFHGTITATAVEETNLLTMTVKGDDPREVFVATRAMIDHHDIVTKEVLGNTVLDILQEPVVPSAPSNSKGAGRMMTMAAAAAAFAVIAVLSYISLMSDRIRGRAEADNKLSCRVLGELYHENKYRTVREFIAHKKSSILISNPVTSFAYTESMHKLSNRIKRRLHRDEKVIMVTSLLENEGKSTMAVNLALSLVRDGRKVLLIDCDLRKPSCSVILNQERKEKGGVIDVLLGSAAMEDCVQQLEGSGLYLLADSRSLRTATNLSASQAMDEMLRRAAAQYDYVVVDTPPMSLTPDAECLSEFADAAVLVVRQNRAKAGDLNDVIAVLEKSNAHLLGCVLNDIHGLVNFASTYSYGSSGAYGKYGKYGRYGSYGGYGKANYDRYSYSSRKNAAADDAADERVLIGGEKKRNE